jgi:hypothetical protein
MKMRLLQEDYWSMDDETLANLATKYHIPHIGRAGEHGQHWYMDRDYVIERLTARDKARQASFALIISGLAILVSVASLLVVVLSR